MNQPLNALPELPEKMVFNVKDLSPAEEILNAEVKALRMWCSQIFMQMKEWSTRMADLDLQTKQILATKAEDDKTRAEMQETLELLTNIVVPDEGDTYSGH